MMAGGGKIEVGGGLEEKMAWMLVEALGHRGDVCREEGEAERKKKISCTL